MDQDLIRYVGDSLVIPTGSLTAATKARREEAIAEAKGWPSGSGQTDKIATRLFEDDGGYTVALAKPGKEAAPGYEPHNAWDMTPVVHYKGSDVGYLPTFSDLFSALQAVAVSSQSSQRSLEILGHLFARSAYMFDHQMSNDGWRYSPPEQAVALVESDVTHVDGLPLRVFLQVIDAIALNEDVKYTSRSGSISNAGRVNTLLTFAHLCAVFVGQAGLGAFAGAFARPPLGLSPLSQTDVRLVFPLLEPDSSRVRAAASVCDPVLQTLEPLIGETVSEIFKRTGGTEVSINNKGRLNIAINRAVAASANRTVRNRFTKCAQLKVIRTDRSLKPAEDISFAPFSREDVLEAPWPKSSFRAQVHTPMLFAVFSETPKGDERLEGVYPAMIALDEIETEARMTWKRTVEALRAARRDLLPLASQSAFFIRNHAGRKVIDDAGETVTPLSFWLSRHYVKQLLLRGLPRA